eukprot:scaffold296913_cov15-Tisochrysis_lutea.AAC.1
MCKFYNDSNEHGVQFPNPKARMVIHMLQGIFGMHWPVVVAPGSLTLRIAKQQQDQREIAEAAE